MVASQDKARVPPVTPWLLRGFTWYARRFVRRNFHALRSLASSADVPSNIPQNRPLIVYMNHPSWWDPMLAVVAATECFSEYQHFAAIDERALEQYRVFAKVGFFGVDIESGRGGVAFLRTAEAILRASGTVHDDRPHAVWVTAQGGFTDVRDRPLRLRPGVAAAVDRLSAGDDVTVLPLAVEIVHWNERYPEALLAWGAPMAVNALKASARVDSSADTAGNARRGRIDVINAALESQLTHTMDALADAARSRNPDRFVKLLDDAGGRGGVGGVYDMGRRLRRWIKGKTLRSRSSTAISSPCRMAPINPLLLLAGAALLLAALPAGMIAWNLLVFRRLPPTHPGSQGLPRVSVLIPARDEEASIEAAARSVLASRGVDIELLVLDDHSRDATSAIVNRLAEEDPRVSLHPAPPPTAGLEWQAARVPPPVGPGVVRQAGVDRRRRPPPPRHARPHGAVSGCVRRGSHQRLPPPGHRHARRDARGAADPGGAAGLPADRDDADVPLARGSARGAGSSSWLAATSIKPSATRLGEGRAIGGNRVPMPRSVARCTTG